MPRSEKSTKADWWKQGIRFQCQGSGKCCVSRGEYGFVYVTLEDRQELAKLLKMSTARFTKTYCQKTDGVFHLKDEPGNPDCVFLKDKRCTVYKARPGQCRTWPFWPENMKAKVWKSEIQTFCPGIGKGRVWDQTEISENLKEQSAWEEDLAKDYWRRKK